MIVTIDLGSDRPLFAQIVDGVKRSIVDETLTPGDRLPPGRELAASLDVSLETVQRAYRLLAEEGLVVSRVGRGTRIAESVSIDELAIDSLITSLVQEARQLGISKTRLATLVDDAWR